MEDVEDDGSLGHRSPRTKQEHEWPNEMSEMDTYMNQTEDNTRMIAENMKMTSLFTFWTTCTGCFPCSTLKIVWCFFGSNIVAVSDQIDMAHKKFDDFGNKLVDRVPDDDNLANKGRTVFRFSHIGS